LGGDAGLFVVARGPAASATKGGRARSTTTKHHGGGGILGGMSPPPPPQRPTVVDRGLVLVGTNHDPLPPSLRSVEDLEALLRRAART